MKTIRILVGLVVLAAVVAGGIYLSAAPKVSTATAEGVPHFTRSEQCAGCHSKIYAEWRESWHGKAYTDADVLELSQNFSDQQCISCHAPDQVFKIGVGERVFERNEHREDGVDCIACHVRRDGRVVGKRGLDAPCRPVKDERLGTAQFCAGCHNQHWTVDEFQASKWSDTYTCNDCHMPRFDRQIADGNYPVRKAVASHVFQGGHYLWMLKKAATMETEVKDGKLIVRVTNSGAGHKLPTDARHRSVNVLVSVRDAEGNLLVDQKEIAEYRLYYRDQHLEPTQLLPHETREEVYQLPAGTKGTATVELVYCLKPPQKVTKDWTVVKTLQQPF